MLLRDCVEKYLTEFAMEHGEKQALFVRRAFLGPFLEYAGESPITRPLLMTWRAQLHLPRTNQSGPGRRVVTRGASTRNRIIGSVRAFLNWCRKYELLDLTKDAIYDTLENFKEGKRPPVALTEEQLLALCSAVHSNDQTPRRSKLRRWFLLGLLTGARPGELKALQWRDLDLERMTLRVNGQKTNTVRLIPLQTSALLTRALTLWNLIDGGRPEGYILPQQGQTKSAVWERVFRAAGIDGGLYPALTTPRIFRTTAVAYAASAAAGVEAEYLLESRFGHTSGVSKRFYRQPLHQVKGRGPNQEDLYGPAVRESMSLFLDRDEQELVGK